MVALRRTYADHTADYGKARAGVAVADNPAGPFKFVGTYLLASDPDRTSHGFDSEGGHVRDMNVFKDDDGTATFFTHLKETK